MIRWMRRPRAPIAMSTAIQQQLQRRAPALVQVAYAIVKPMSSAAEWPPESAMSVSARSSVRSVGLTTRT